MQSISKAGFLNGFGAIFLIAGMLFLIFQNVFQFNGLYGQDSHAYYQYSLTLHEWLSGENVEFGYFFWPKLFPFLGAVVSFIGIDVLTALQLISFLSFVGTCVFLLKSIDLLHQKNGFILILLGVLTQIYFMRGGFLVMSDMLTTFLCSAGFYYYLTYTKHENWRPLILFALCFVLAFFARYTSIVLLAIPSMHICYLMLKKGNVLNRSILIVATICGIILLIFFNGRFIQSALNVIGGWSLFNLFARTFYSSDGVISNTVPNGMYVFGNFFHFGYLSFGVLLLPFFQALKNSNRILIVSVCFYLLFLAGHSMQNYRFLMIVHPFVLMLIFPAFDSLSLWLKSKNLYVVFLIGVLVFNLSFAWYSFRKTLKVHRIEIEVAKIIQEQNHKGTIYSFYVDQSFKSYHIDNQVKNFYYEDYRSFEKGALVVFNEKKFKDQWKDHKVMRNWQRLAENYRLDTLSLLSDNWAIYRIK